MDGAKRTVNDVSVLGKNRMFEMNVKIHPVRVNRKINKLACSFHTHMGHDNNSYAKHEVEEALQTIPDIWKT